ncbi:MAG TPA: DUF6599 family protein [Candidatus Heimdallarchaeota archaeon]|nr:DUF6599 family protein [Candidatus Heimdallarchaeota archaeon]
MPTASEIDNWERNLDFEEYKGEDLFFYINGGAEIYHEYGFERVIVQDYQNRNGRSASLEVYKMSSPDSAYGMYTFKSSGKGQELTVGHGCKLQDYYLNFWKGQYLVTITGFDAEKETIDGLKSIANVVDKKIQTQANAEMPVIHSRLPQEDLDAQSVKYFKGNLGLVNSYPFANTDIFKIQEGIKGTYSNGYDIYILEYKDAEASQMAFDSVKKDFKDTVKYQNVTIGQDRIELEDDSGIQIVVQPYRSFILIVLGTKSPAQATQILKNLKNHIN